jgi:hypothetical protein
LWRIHTNNLPLGTSRISQGSKQIEDGWNAKGLSHRHDMARRGVMVNGKAEANTSFIHAPTLGLTPRINMNPQLHEHLSTAATSSASVAMLRDLRTCCSRNDGRGSGDVEQLCGATGTRSIQERVRRNTSINRVNMGAHDRGGTGKFISGGHARG